MSFEIKYDREGQPIRTSAPESTQIDPVVDTPIDPVPEDQARSESSESLTVLEEGAPDAQEVKPQAPEEDIYVKNYRAIRTKAERLERERDEAIRRLQEIESSTYSTKAPVETPHQTEDEVRVGDDDLVEGKHLTKFGRKVKELENKLRQYEQQSTMATTEVRLKSQYPDFDKIVSKDNIDMLKDAYPELYSTIYTSNDLYNKAVSAYTLIKKLGIHREDTHIAEKALVQKNAAKPRPLASVAPQQGDTPLSKANAFANGLTEDLKAQLLKEMQDIRRNY